MNYALHEVLEVQELTAFKTACLTKSKTMKALVSDQKLKDIMQQDVDLSTRQLQEFEAILSNVSKNQEMIDYESNN
ncbi:hypothetical protein [Amphibacillus sediminis]|uniref:hypothetical protein n=1 Tax=Amphibacillus sediminis TaxID=360185 RepID=UPI00083617D0|nr:hypothetical protein [Amphibacillus sediminis]